MTKLNALIVDDEPLAHDVLITYCNNIPFVSVKHQCYSATQALEYLKTHSIDLLFLDINMPMLTGLDLLRVLKKQPEVIITSAYQEYALEGFELSVTDYLLKPFSFERCLTACNTAFKQHALLTTAKQVQLTPSKKAKSLFLKIDKQQVKIDLTKVSFFESYGNYVKIWQEGKSRLTARTLTSIEAELPNYFLRVRKSAIINLDFIHSIDSNEVVLKDGSAIKIGKSYKTVIQAYLRNVVIPDVARAPLE